jgi:hypothetical protein
MNAWSPVTPCAQTPGPVPPTTIFCEMLTVEAPNVLSGLTYAPDGQFIQLIINNAAVFMPVGNPPPFTVSGTAITWLSSVFGFDVGDTVVASYTY